MAAKYYAAAYLRLSRDDRDKHGAKKKESDSIGSQREIIRRFIESHREIELFDVYVDDGYSGVNFERPSFKRMMEDIKSGRVNCVIVKDLSRFGRDYIETGRLLQKVFPSLSVRFIAISDCYDSETADHGSFSLALPLKNFINDSYCRDISEKVRSQQKIKREQGKFIGAFAVYGYRKSSQDKNRLEPDEYAAEIVKLIFSWKLEGLSCRAIARRLNGQGVYSPLEYKRLHGEKYDTGFQTNPLAKWSAAAVKRILSNEVYTGALIQGKQEKISYKMNQYRSKPKEEWAKTPCAHQGIISMKDYQKAQKMMGFDMREGRRPASQFAGLLFCGDCKSPMVRRISRYKGKERTAYVCSSCNKGMDCSRHKVAEEELCQVVFQALKTYTALFMDREEMKEYMEKAKGRGEKAGAFRREWEKEREEEKAQKAIEEGMGEDVKGKIISEEEFHCWKELYRKQREGRQEAAKRQEKMIEKIERKGRKHSLELERFRRTMEIRALDRKLLITFVDEILVYENKRIAIRFSCQDGFFGA